MVNRALTLYQTKEEIFGDALREIERIVLLRSVDSLWMEHIDMMDDLKGSIGLNAYAQRDPINEYRIQGADMFDAMIDEIRMKTVRTLLSIVKREAPVERRAVLRATASGFEGDKKVAPKKTPVIRKQAKVGANDLCPCGSGKKYKRCCGARD
jgi:preprotein translocase subunit SecA